MLCKYKKQDRDNATSYLQRPYNAGPMSTTLGQELTSKYVGLTHDITVGYCSNKDDRSN